MYCTCCQLTNIFYYNVGYDLSGARKPVPAKALLPVLDILVCNTPTPPPGPPPEIQRPASESFKINLY